MRNVQFVLFTAIAVLDLAIGAQAATITVGNYLLQPNLAGQQVVLNVTDIVPNAGNIVAPGNVNGMTLTVAIAGGGPAYGGILGPKITSIDVDSGPSIWAAPNSPAGHTTPSLNFDPDGQVAQISILTVSGFVNVTSGILATLIIDTTGIHGQYKLTLSGGVIESEFGDTELTGGSPTTIIDYLAYHGTAGQIGDLGDPFGQPPEVPEPSSVALAAIGLIGFAAWGWRRKR